MDKEEKQRTKLNCNDYDLECMNCDRVFTRGLDYHEVLSHQLMHKKAGLDPTGYWRSCNWPTI